MYGRPALGPGRANEYRLMTAWDEHTDITCSTYSSVADSYAQLARQVGSPENNYEDAQRGIYMDLWHLSAGKHPNEGTPAQIKAYLDTVASHIAAGRLKAITYKELYENYLYSEPKLAVVEPG